MSKKVRKKWVTWTLILMSLALFALVVLRALHVPITHDEAYSYQHYVKKGFWHIVSYGPPHIPNNHILNSLGMLLGIKLFGLSLFNLRLASVLLSAVYFWYAVAFSKSFRTPFIQIACFLILALQVYFFDWFALARGYGMGIAFSLASLFHLLEFRQLDNGHHIWRTLIFGALAVYANFTFLYFYLAVIGVLLIVWLAKRTHKSITYGVMLRPIIIVSLSLGALIFVPIRNISNDLFGGSSNFWNDSVKTLTYRMSYGSLEGETEALSLFFIGLFLLLGAFFFVYDVYNEGMESKLRFYQEALLVLVITAGVQILQHHILGTEYLMGRTALLYAPLFLVFLIFLLQRFNELASWGENTQNIAVGVLALLFGFAFISNYNTQQSFEWQYDAQNDEAIKNLIEKGQKEGQTIEVGITWLFEPGFNFYRELYQAEAQLAPFERSSLEKEQAIYLLLEGYDQEWIDSLESQNWDLSAYYPIAKARQYQKP
jgi:uncharacterized membrane protein